MNLFSYIEEFFLNEIHFRKWNPNEKRIKKKSIRKARRGTNFKLLKPKKGHKRIKLTGTNRYIRVPMSSTEKIAKKKIGQRLGKNPLF